MLKTRVTNAIQVGGTLVTDPVIVPGIVTGAAYAALDVMGELFEFPNVTRLGIFTGTLQAATYYDVDDEGLQVNLWLYDRPVTLGADNAAHVLSDTDLLRVVDVIPFLTFFDANTGQVSFAKGNGKPFKTFGGTSLWASVQAIGAVNIAAANIPRFSIATLAD